MIKGIAKRISFVGISRAITSNSTRINLEKVAKIEYMCYHTDNVCVVVNVVDRCGSILTGTYVQV